MLSIPDIQFIAQQNFTDMLLSDFIEDKETHPDSVISWTYDPIGEITAVTITLDGLAVALLTSLGDGRPRQGSIIAQALTVRDTLDINFVLADQ